VDVLTANPRVAEYYQGVARAHGNPKVAANWVMGEVLAQLKTTGDDIGTFRVRPHDLAELLNLLRDGMVTHTAAKQVFARMVVTGDPPAQVAEREGLVRVDDDAQLAGWLDEVIAEYPAEAARYRAGERKLQGVFVGAVMKKSKGRADAKAVGAMLAERLGSAG
jgi:aspartyl-tRNA(Asn)/glutamyl-tRNA(Gln) amidotransferase subunit B